MRLSDEARRKLDWQLRLRKLKIAGLVVGVLVLAGLAMEFEDIDHAVTNRNVAGVVDSVAPSAAKGSPSGALLIGVALDEGRHVQVLARSDRDLKVGERISVVEHKHGSGRLTHSLH